jgi:hypothetical protein
MAPTRLAYQPIMKAAMAWHGGGVAAWLAWHRWQWHGSHQQRTGSSSNGGENESGI